MIEDENILPDEIWEENKDLKSINISDQVFAGWKRTNSEQWTGWSKVMDNIKETLTHPLTTLFGGPSLDEKW